MAKTILVVEDDADVLGILISSLEGEGYTVVAATDGRQALERAGSSSPDLILLDMMLPVMSGYDVMPALKADPLTAAIPVVGISARATAADVAQARRLGMDAYITKPFRISEVLETIQAYL
jgi:CheY-like chemotaxis protein